LPIPPGIRARIGTIRDLAGFDMRPSSIAFFPRGRDRDIEARRPHGSSRPPAEGDQMLNVLFFLALQSSVPNVDIDKICSTAAQAALPEDAARAAKSCRDDEASARETLRTQWSGYPASAKDNCATGPELQFSYVELLTCIQIQNPHAFEKAQPPGLELKDTAPIEPPTAKF
jgi:hypothetical protein